MRVFFLLLLSCVSCLAQFGVEQPMFKLISTTSALTLPAGIGYWWVASDLSNSPVTIWTDRIQGVGLTNTGAARPTWSADGVRFTKASSQFLETNSNVYLRCNSGAAGYDTFLIILDRASVGEQYVFTVSGSSTPDLGFTAGGLWYNPNGSFGSTTVGVWYEFLYGGVTNSVSTIYTNGIVAANKAIASEPLRWLGRHEFGSFYDGTIKEFIIWTNVAGFNSVQVSNVHYYVTNKYGFSP